MENRGISQNSIEKTTNIAGTGEGGAGRAMYVYCWDLFSRAPDDAQMQDKCQNTDLNICL